MINATNTAQPSENTPVFLDAATAAFGAEGKVKVVWTKLCTFAITEELDTVDVTKTRFKEEEGIYAKATKRKLTSMVAYRTAKSTITRAIKFSVSLTGDKGEPKGKTDVESEIRKAKGEPVAFDKLKKLLSAATSASDNLIAEDEIATAAALAADLADKLKKEYKRVARQAA